MTSVPDLAFNEMKFLRDFNQHQDQHGDHGSLRKPSNQEKKREAEREEISAYFNERAPHDRNPGPRLDVRQTGEQTLAVDARVPNHDGRLDHEGSSPMLREEELPAVPYLGFGSKGTANQSSNPHPSTTSYLTWSESVPGHVQPEKTLFDHKAIRKTSRLPVAAKTQTQRLEHHAEATTKPNRERPVPGNQSQQTQGYWEKSRRTKGPAAVDVYVPSDPSGHEPSTGVRRARDTTSLSLPTAPPKMSQAGRQKMNEHQDHPPSGAETFHTSDILKVRGRMDALARPPQQGALSDFTRHSDKENIGPSTSPMAKVLRMAQGAMMQNRLEPEAQPRTATLQPDDRFVPAENGDLHYSRAPIQHQMAQHRLQNLAHVVENTVRPPTATLPNYRCGVTQRDDLYTPPAPFQLQMARPHLRSLAHQEYSLSPNLASTSLRSHYNDQRLQQDIQDHQNAYVNPDDADMLDVYSPAKPGFSGFASSTGDQAHGFAYTAPTQSDLHSLHFRYDRPSTRMRGTPWSRGDVSTTLRETPSHMYTGQQDMSAREDQDLGGLQLDDGLKGFWRPNRLY